MLKNSIECGWREVSISDFKIVECGYRNNKKKR